MSASMMHGVSQVPIACGRQHKHLILMSLCPHLTFVGGMLLVYLCGCWYGPCPAAAFLWLVLSGLGFLLLVVSFVSTLYVYMLAIQYAMRWQQFSSMRRQHCSSMHDTLCAA
jgi:hypothetical protein